MHNCKPSKQMQDIETLYDLAEFFKVFGDSTRIRILCSLLNGSKCVYHIAEELNMGQSAISHQLRILRNAGLAKREREGKTIMYSLDDEHVEQIIDLGLIHILHKQGKPYKHIKEAEDEQS